MVCHMHLAFDVCMSNNILTDRCSVPLHSPHIFLLLSLADHPVHVIQIGHHSMKKYCTSNDCCTGRELMLLHAETFIGGRDGVVFCMGTG